jgi:4a-hydroxytetrahydrobiopterin dehydratase
MWQNQNNTLTRTFLCKDFRKAMAFMLECAFVAEQMEHHPEWSNVYNKIIINLRTHDAGNTITQKDYDLADEIDKIFENYQ